MCEHTHGSTRDSRRRVVNISQHIHVLVHAHICDTQLHRPGTVCRRQAARWPRSTCVWRHRTCSRRQPTQCCQRREVWRSASSSSDRCLTCSRRSVNTGVNPATTASGRCQQQVSTTSVISQRLHLASWQWWALIDHSHNTLCQQWRHSLRLWMAMSKGIKLLRLWHVMQCSTFKSSLVWVKRESSIKGCTEVVTCVHGYTHLHIHCTWRQPHPTTQL